MANIERRRDFRPKVDLNTAGRGDQNPSLGRPVYIVATEPYKGINRPCGMNSRCPQESPAPNCCEKFTCP